MYFIGLDIGTSGLKAGVINEEGVIVASAYWETKRVSSEPGRMEQDIDEILTHSLKITKTVMERAEVESREIGAVVLDGQMAGIIGVDREFTSITGLDSNLDLQSEKYNLMMHERFPDLLAQVTCGSPLNGQKILKWKQDYPETYEKVHKFVTLNGYVAGKLAGLKGDDAFIDHTLLAFFGFESARDLSWSEELCERLEVDREKLPEVVPPHRVVGTIDKRAAQLSGLKQGTPVLAGAGDQAAGLIGMGMLEPGLMVDVSGSSTLLFVCVDGFVPDVKNRKIMYIPSVEQGIYYAFTYINGGGMSIPWYVEDILGKGAESEADRYAALTELASRVPPGSNGLLFIPYFGGRQCPFDVSLRGGWLGLTWGHKREHLYRAILESIAYVNYSGFRAITQMFPAVRATEILVAGGGAGNDLWNQIKADVFGVTYRKLKGYEYAIRGCGMIAAYGCGVFDDFGSAISHMSPGKQGEIFLPDNEKNAVYASYCDIFEKIFSRDLRETLYSLLDVATGEHFS
jgi:xylulokinase